MSKPIGQRDEKKNLRRIIKEKYSRIKRNIKERINIRKILIYLTNKLIEYIIVVVVSLLLLTIILQLGYLIF